MTDPKVTIKPITDYRPDPENANRHTERGYEMVNASLKEHGAGRSIVVAADNTAVAGSSTLENAVDAGFQQVIEVETDGKTLVVVKRGDWPTADHPEAQRYGIADNRTAEVGLEWNTAVLSRIMAENEDQLKGLFTRKELQLLIARNGGNGDGRETPAPEDKAGELAAQWETAEGGVWEIPSLLVPGKSHRLMCGDSTNPDHVARLLEGATPRLMVTDPPYGVDYDPRWRNAIQGEFGNDVRQGTPILNDDRADWFDAWQHSPAIVAYVWHGGLHASQVEHSLTRAGYLIRYQIIWVKQHYAISRGNYHWLHEPCWYAVKEGENALFLGDRTNTTVWEINSLNAAGRQEDRVSHGNQKPLECMARPIRLHEGDVYDPFVGSGTTLLAAEQNARIGYGLDLDPKAIAVALTRLTDAGLTPKRLV